MRRSTHGFPDGEKNIKNKFRFKGEIEDEDMKEVGDGVVWNLVHNAELNVKQFRVEEIRGKDPFESKTKTVHTHLLILSLVESLDLK
ncbi:hypothetical protein CEXT_227301 [Caerostris extrusa]|uniref:Uncharacterized protein n=1 Tax=Caerostris extrusa TaxID=172846 RepID=A0AAV4XIT9_CAEEX|nr:hypothetical protein CEXT_227301 [Caerostris extrusa]